MPPQGSAADVPVHFGAVCIFSFPEKIAATALSSSTDFEIQPWGEDGVAVRAINRAAAPSTVALATMTGQIKVNVTMHVVPDSDPALTLVRFEAVSEAEAFDAQVKAGIARGVAPIRQRLQQARKHLDELIRKRSDRQIAQRFLRRGEVVNLKTHARNRDHVILHVWRGLLLGDDGYLIFEIETAPARRIESPRCACSKTAATWPAPSSSPPPPLPATRR